MAGPWEKYQTAQPSGPWDAYKSQTPMQSAMDDTFDDGYNTPMGPINDGKTDIEERTPNLSQRIMEDLQPALQEQQDIRRMREAGELGFGPGVVKDITGAIEGGYYEGGLVGAPVVYETVGETAKSAYGKLPGPVRRGIEGTAVAIGKGAKWVGERLPTNLPEGQPQNVAEFLPEAIGAGGQAVGEYLEDRPRLDKFARSTANIAGLALPSSKGVTTTMRKTLDPADMRMNKAKEMVLKRDTPTVGAERAKRTQVTGVGKRSEYIPTSREADMADALNRVEGWTPKDTFQMTLNKAQNKAYKMADELQTDLDQRNILIPRQEHRSALKSAVDEVKQESWITGDVEAYADKLMSQYEKILDKHPGTAGGALRARKEFDQWVNSQNAKLNDVADGAKINAGKAANAAIRRKTNELIDQKVPDAKVKESLKEQSLLFDTVDNLAPKAYREGNSAFERMAQKMTGNTTLKGLIAGLGIGGIGIGSLAASGLGAAAAPLTIGAAGLYLGGKALGSGPSKFILNQMLKRSADMQDLRVDRAIMLEYLNSLPDEGPEEEVAAQ